VSSAFFPSKIRRLYQESFEKIEFCTLQGVHVVSAKAAHFFAEPSTWLVSKYLWRCHQLFSTQIFAEMTRKKIRVGARPTRRDRDRKARDALRKAHQRAAKAATLREEVGDIEEAVVPYEHKGGQAGVSIRLRRMNPSSVSGDAAQPAPQDSLPGATGNQRQGPQPGSILHQFQNLLAHE
jgi:hypothetical protein